MNELAIQIRNTAAFIMANPSSIVIERGTSARTAAGGTVRSSEALLEPQTVRLIAQLTTATRGQEGQEPVTQFVLLAMPNADIQRGDRFVLEGTTTPWYYIPRLTDSMPYELRGDVLYAR